MSALHDMIPHTYAIYLKICHIRSANLFKNGPDLLTKLSVQITTRKDYLWMETVQIEENPSGSFYLVSQIFLQDLQICQ